MINGNITEFIDKLYYGEELLFEYQKETFFLQGWTKDDLAQMVLDHQTDEPFEKYIWECSKPSMRECAEAFLNASIWGGKCFYQIEREVIWKD